MTNEEAIQTIKSISQWEYWQNDTLEAFVLAIKALETGEVYMTGEDYNLYMEGYKTGKKDFEPKQGEWIYLDKDDYMKVECPFCHERKCCISNYCDNCGADMRKGGTE